MFARRLQHSTLSINLRHTENVRQPLRDAPITGKHGDKEVVLKTVTMFSTHVAKQQTTVPKTNNNLDKVAVLLQQEISLF